jgi:hypothetical protein
LAIKRRQDSAEQIVATLRQAELGMPVSEQERQLGISAQTFYCWKKQYAGLESNQVREPNAGTGDSLAQVGLGGRPVINSGERARI